MVNRLNWKTISRRGFTLIELAIVLVIVGLLIGIGTSMVGVLSSAVKVRETKDLLDANMQAVTSWASAANRLPGAASGFGNFTSIAKSRQDSWGRPFTFLYYSSLARTNPTKDTICGRRSTPLNVQTTDPAATISNVAFVILSSGDNSAPKSLKSTLNSAPITVSIPAIGTISVNPAASDNDIARWVTLDELRSKIGCQGAPLKIVNNELPFGAAPNPYSATISADGGVPSSSGNYEWCVEFPTPLRSGFSFETSPSNGIKTVCSGATFVAGQNLSLSKKTSFGNFSSGSHKVTVYVRDSAGNDANKTFVLTINPN